MVIYNDMKLLLTSQGLTNKKLINEFKKLIEKPLNKVRVLMISTGPENKVTKYINEFKEPLLKTGIKNETIDSLYMDNPIDHNLSIYDVIFICGGNTYLYLKYIRELGLDKQIIKHIKSNKLYIGVSAGSMIIGPTIEQTREKNTLGLKDLSGLKIIDIAIRPHYEPSQDEWIKKLKKKIPKLKTITDEQAVLITKGETKII